MTEEDRKFAISQAVWSSVALLIAGPVVAVRFAANPLFAAFGWIAAVAGAGLLIFAIVRYRGAR